MPPCCSPAYRCQVAEAFALLPAPHPATEALLPRQHPGTGGAASRPPFRPDRSADRAMARAAASLRARQQGTLSSSTVGPLGAASGAATSAATSGIGGMPAAAAAAVPAKAPLVPAAAAAPAAPPEGGHHRRKPSLLEQTLSAVKGSIAGGASWMWNTRDPGGCLRGRGVGGGGGVGRAKDTFLSERPTTLSPSLHSHVPWGGGGGGGGGGARARARAPVQLAVWSIGVPALPTVNPRADNLFSYDWRSADAGDTDTTASAPPLPAQDATQPPHAGSRPGGGGGCRGPAMA